MELMNEQDVRFLTVDEFAKRIGVHPQTVRQWDKTGVLLPHHKTPSGRRLYSEEQVSDYFNNDNTNETNK